MLLQRMTLVLGGLLAGAGTIAGQRSAPTPAQKDTAAAAITPAMIARGDSIFHGQAAGGTCFVCHGAKAKGNPGLAPDLTSGKWLSGDGSYQFIVQAVEQGVAKPKQAPIPMPPTRGALAPVDIRAVAAYVYSLSHPHGS